ncbi:MAG: SAM-dependent methyltransferase [Gammaproteobacteria bacterium]
MNSDDYKRFENLTFEDFRRLAGDESLSRYEKIGFPDTYRDGKEAAIWRDIMSKLPALSSRNKVVLDIGPGCSELPSMLIDLCREKEHKLLLVDSAEMLSHLPDEPFIEKHAGYYPDCPELFENYRGRVDVLLSYSVLHYVFAESNIWHFFDTALELLAHGGEMLVGDIPNVSKRKRFFSSPEGIAFHRAFTGNPEDMPEVGFNHVQPQVIDDAVVLGLVNRVRLAGSDAYIVPQAPDLPLANRREDLLIRKP